MDYKTLPAAANTVPLLLVAILGLPLSTASQYDHTYYVTPNVSLCTNVNNTCQDFRTYFNNASYYFQSGTEFIFLPGVHLLDLDSILSVQDIVNLRLVGSDTFTQHSVVENVVEYGFDPYAYDNNVSYLQSSTVILCTSRSGLSFFRVTNLTLANLTMLNCGKSIALSSVYNLLIDGLTVQNSSEFEVFGTGVLGQSMIMRSTFVGNNNLMYGFILFCTDQPCGYIEIVNCKFISLSFFSYYGTIDMHFKDASFYGCSINAESSILNILAIQQILFFGYNLFVQSSIFLTYSSIGFCDVNTFIQSNITAQYYCNVTLCGNSTFSSNYVSTIGGAISISENSALVFGPNSSTVFINNTASYGGAIYIDSSNCYVNIISPANVSFINNTAFIQGGAIFVEAPASANCFYSLNCTDIEDIHLYFEGNYAGDAGSVLYGGNIDTCQLENCSYNSTYIFDTITEIGYQDPSTSLISSDSPCIYPCDALANLACLTGQSVSLYSGQIPKVTFITVGQRNSIVPTVILVYSNAGNRVINVFRTLKQCNSYEVHYDNDNGTIKLITDSGLNFYSLDISILPCPALFTNDNVTSSCICDPLLQRYNFICNISDVTVLNAGNIWIGLTSQGAAAFQDPCPFDYCTGNKTINVLDLDSQCSYNRSGVLCGQCQGNLSMTFGTSRCANCSNYYLLLIIVFIVMGVLLVVVLFISKFTVANGALNGIVLYANLIRINDTIFFQNRNGYSSFLSAFIAWINLDWGIETCFYNGMDSYAKTWLQFVFPMSIIGVVVLAARYSSSLSKLFRFNAVPVLSTLVLLSYSKILQTTITILSSVSLKTMNSGADPYVWQYDGNIEYFGQKHLPLFIFAMFVIIIIIIPYLAILLLAPCLQTRSHWRGLQWINNLKPFLDSYQAPFKDHYRFWPGVLLFIRLPLYLVFMLSESTPVKMLAIITCVLMYLCIAVGLSVYKKWSDLLIEMAFIINISIISATVTAIGDSGSREMIVTLGITCAVILTVCILGYARVYNIWKKASNLTRTQVNKETSPLNNGSGTDKEESFEHVRDYREPLIEMY